MHGGQLRNLYERLDPRLKLSLLSLGALAASAFVVFLLLRISSWHASYFRNLALLRSPLPVAEEHHAAAPQKQSGTAEEEETESASMGAPAMPGNARRIWNWPDDLSLAKKALAEFRSARQWDTALSIGTNLGRDTVFRDEVFQLVDQSYLAHAGGAVAEEKKEMRLQHAENTLFDRAAFLVNFRIRLVESVKVSSIAEIMTESYFESVSDPFVKWLADSPELRSRRIPIRYGNDADAEFRTLIGNDLSGTGRYMKTRWDMFTAALAKRPELAAALHAAPATERQRALMEDFSSEKRKTISSGEYHSLPRLWRWFFGKAAVAAFGPGAKTETLAKVFSGNVDGLEWMDMLKKGVRLSPSVRAFFRSRPQWLASMNARNYDEAVARFRNDARTILPGGEDPALENDLKSMAELEKSLMKQYFPDSAWKAAAARRTETKASANLETKDFLDVVKTLLKNIPDTEVGEERKKAFLALCRLNRGANGRNVHLLAGTTNESLIKHHIPAEELNDE